MNFLLRNVKDDFENFKQKGIIDIEKRLRPRKSEVDRLSNNKKAKKILNWKPKYVGKKVLRQQLKKHIDGFKELIQIL